LKSIQSAVDKGGEGGGGGGVGSEAENDIEAFI
jgi:hypothetical protein